MLLEEEFDYTVGYISESLDTIIVTAQDMMESKDLQEILYLVLITGNFLNAVSLSHSIYLYVFVRDSRVAIYTRCQSMPTIGLCPLSIYAHCLSMPTVYLCPLSIYAHCLSMPAVGLCPLSTYARCRSMPAVYLCPL